MAVFDRAGLLAFLSRFNACMMEAGLDPATNMAIDPDGDELLMIEPPMYPVSPEWISGSIQALRLSALDYGPAVKLLEATERELLTVRRSA